MTYRRIGVSVKIFERTNHFITWIAARPVLVCKYEGSYYGMDAVCSHTGCALLEIASGKYAECPAHGAKYDVTSGEMTAEARIHPEANCEYDSLKIPLKTYNVREKEGFIEVEI